MLFSYSFNCYFIYLSVVWGMGSSSVELSWSPWEFDNFLCMIKVISQGPRVRRLGLELAELLSRLSTRRCSWFLFSLQVKASLGIYIPNTYYTNSLA